MKNRRKPFLVCFRIRIMLGIMFFNKNFINVLFFIRSAFMLAADRTQPGTSNKNAAKRIKLEMDDTESIQLFSYPFFNFQYNSFIFFFSQERVRKERSKTYSELEAKIRTLKAENRTLLADKVILQLCYYCFFKFSI